MLWELGLPLLVMLATCIVMGFLVIAGRKLIFSPRRDDHMDQLT